jgi:hypothetical protein
MIHQLINLYEQRDTEDNIKKAVINKQFRQWAKTYTDLNIDYQKTISLLRKQKSFNTAPDDIQHMYKECLSRDITTLLKSVFAFYEKKHKIVLHEEDTNIIKNLSSLTVENAINMFNQTIGPIEKRYALFANRNVRQKKTGTPKKLGEFNLFIKEQWATRKDELSALCKDGKGSSSVMKKLAGEWKSRKSTVQNVV